MTRHSSQGQERLNVLHRHVFRVQNLWLLWIAVAEYAIENCGAGTQYDAPHGPLLLGMLHNHEIVLLLHFVCDARPLTFDPTDGRRGCGILVALAILSNWGFGMKESSIDTCKRTLPPAGTHLKSVVWGRNPTLAKWMVGSN